MLKIYQILGVANQARINCISAKNDVWREKWEDKINTIVNNYLPHGSGIDGKLEFNFEKSTQDKLIIDSEFHFMNENGFYDGWSNFSVVVTPDWRDCNIYVVGRFRKKYSDTKDYLQDIFSEALMTERANIDDL